MALKDLMGQQTDRGLVISYDQTKNGNAYWNVRDDDGTVRSIRGSRLKVEQLWHVKSRSKFIYTEQGKERITEVPLLPIADVIEELARLKEQAKDDAHEPTEIIRDTDELTGNLLEVNIPDAHFGKQAWPVETGGAPYDVKIAQATYMAALDAIIARSGNYKYDEILFVVGNDLLNSNDAENRTAHGTIVTTDGRYHKTFWKVRATIVEAIEKLRLLAPVRVMMVYGNHDTLAAWHLGDSLECYFHKYTDVFIENTPRYRKYYEFGKCMWMFTHGDKGRRTDYPLLMATEQSAMFGRTKFRECHTGHTHMTKLDEQHGVRVRVLPALCPEDDWHAENGYTGNLRNAEGYQWNREEGLVGTVIYSANAHETIVTKRELVVDKKGQPKSTIVL